MTSSSGKLGAVNCISDLGNTIPKKQAYVQRIRHWYSSESLTKFAALPESQPRVPTEQHGHELTSRSPVEPEKGPRPAQNSGLDSRVDRDFAANFLPDLRDILQSLR